MFTVYKIFTKTASTLSVGGFSVSYAKWLHTYEHIVFVATAKP